MSEPDLIFLAEPQIFKADLLHCMAPFQGEYSCELNNDENSNPVLAMSKSKAYGGTVVMWRKSLDKFITAHPVPVSGFLPVILSPPGCPTSAHIAMYLPTSGREADFLETVTHLRNTIEEILDRFPDCLFFLRGDCNVNPNNHERVLIFDNLVKDFSLVKVPINHKTYHHFLGGGAFDSSIDIILQSAKSPSLESISTIYCNQEWPSVDSHHDIIISSVKLPVFEKEQEQENLVTAPKLDISRQKVQWSEQGIKMYRELVTSFLTDIRLKWLDPLSRTSLSVLLASTNDILNRCAVATNKSVSLNLKYQRKSEKKPISIRQSEAHLRKVFMEHKAKPTDFSCHNQVKLARRTHRALIRKLKIRGDQNNDENLLSLLTSNPSSAYKALKAAKNRSAVQVPYIKVGNKKYPGERVIDGFYESLLSKPQHNTTQHNGWV